MLCHNLFMTRVENKRAILCFTWFPFFFIWNQVTEKEIDFKECVEFKKSRAQLTVVDRSGRK